MVNVEIVCAIYVEASSHDAFTHYWANVGATAVCSYSISADAGQQLRDLFQIGTACGERWPRDRSPAAYRCRSQTRLQECVAKAPFEGVSISIAAAKSILFVCIQNNSDCATRSESGSLSASTPPMP